MKRGKITCSTSEGPVTVPALVGAYMAVHRSLVAGEYRPNISVDWTVTHIASGFAMEWCDTQREGRAFVEWAEREHEAELAALAKLSLGEGPSKRGKIGSASKRLFAARQQYRERVPA